MKFGITSSTQLREYCRQLGIPALVHMRNELGADVPVNVFHIMNLQALGEPGSHWVIYWRPKGRIVYYSDSYGAPPSQELVDICTTAYLRLIYTHDNLQAIDSVHCGFFCIAFALAMFHSKGPISKRIRSYLKQFDLVDEKRNDKIVERIFEEAMSGNNRNKKTPAFVSE